VLCLARRCVALGAAVCRMVARRADDWGPEAAHLADALNHRHLDHVLDFAADALRSTEAKLARSRKALARDVPDTDPSGCIAFSEAMKRALGLARQAAAVDVPVLVEGESGAGKERLAHVVHDESPRAAGPFVPVNAGAIAGTLLESELFGHRRGAFTGADRDRVGLFEAASGGTLFLDEIGELPLGVQVKLLRVLQEGEVRRLGENTARPIDVRIVAATNRDLEAAIAGGRFRDDLFYRLAVVRIHVAPLRERKDDILPLARHFLGLARERTRKRLHDIAPGAATRLLAYPWPGNVRELQNAILRAAVVAQTGTLEEADLPGELRGVRTPKPAPEAPPSTLQTLEEVERAHVERVLDAHEGHRAAAAKALGISPATLYRKLRRFHPK
ncbi:MAG: sigma 54-interacting transcriptional regulator, partial [Myxococcota bacterium]